MWGEAAHVMAAKRRSKVLANRMKWFSCYQA
jgi:hypothetical protein